MLACGTSGQSYERRKRCIFAPREPVREFATVAGEAAVCGPTEDRGLEHLTQADELLLFDGDRPIRPEVDVFQDAFAMKVIAKFNVVNARFDIGNFEAPIIGEASAAILALIFAPLLFPRRRQLQAGDRRCREVPELDAADVLGVGAGPKDDERQ